MQIVTRRKLPPGFLLWDVTSLSEVAATVWAGVAHDVPRIHAKDFADLLHGQLHGGLDRCGYDLKICTNADEIALRVANDADLEGDHAKAKIARREVDGDIRREVWEAFASNPYGSTPVTQRDGLTLTARYRRHAWANEVVEVWARSQGERGYLHGRG